MTKKVAFGSKPTPRPEPAITADAWVETRTVEQMKRLTIDIPATLHTRIKSTCALRGVKMVDEIRELLEAHFRETGQA
jgi:hypothetical protein